MNSKNIREDSARLIPTCKQSIKRHFHKFNQCIRTILRWKHKLMQWKLKSKTGKPDFRLLKGLKTDNFKNSGWVLRIKRNLNLIDRSESLRLDLKLKEASLTWTWDDWERDCKPRTDKTTTLADKSMSSLPDWDNYQ